MVTNILFTFKGQWLDRYVYSILSHTSRAVSSVTSAYIDTIVFRTFKGPPLSLSSPPFPSKALWSPDSRINLLKRQLVDTSGYFIFTRGKGEARREAPGVDAIFFRICHGVSIRRLLKDSLLRTHAGF